MSAGTKESIQQAKVEISKLKDLWRKNRTEQIELEIVVERKKQTMTVLQREIKEEQNKIKNIKETCPHIEDMINENVDLIIRCKALYPKGH
ncbi:hypothetical protein L6452_28212 [Arctium lappa]|uniref:Uncharacterized protein n=1 Tax=Arctium lappa TaxID=4217 RepID=A0ACB8ZYN7_ARCLA|nr:hypothetical protein L6452_28212 [Arctium lappa]